MPWRDNSKTENLSALRDQECRMLDNKKGVPKLHSWIEMPNSESTYVIVASGSGPSLMNIRGHNY